MGDPAGAGISTQNNERNLVKMFLLGAGASIEAQVPGAVKMTKMILEIIRNRSRFAKHGHALSFVVGGLLFDAGKKNKNPLNPEINVEDLFNAVQLLAERNNLEAAPFIGSWHSFVDELDKIYPAKPNGSLQKLIYTSISKEIAAALSQSASSYTVSQIDKAQENATKKIIEAISKKRSVSLSNGDSVGKAVEKYISETAKKWIDKINHPSSSAISSVDKQVDKAINASQAVSGDGQVFQETSAYMIAALKDLVWISESAKVKYLSPLINVLSNQQKLNIATLNYDNSIELLAKSYNIPCDTGISSWATNGKLSFSDSGINLIKLHGSIDWKETKLKNQGVMPTVQYSKVDHDDITKTDFKPAVIFGSKNKLTAEGPYLDLLRHFSESLDQSDELIVVGYSFRDIHINVYISNWLNMRPENKLFIINGEGYLRALELVEGEYASSLYRVSQTNPEKVVFCDNFAGDGLKLLFNEYVENQRTMNYQITKTAMNEIVQEVEAAEIVESLANETLDQDV